jgi:hypothetical protein
MTLEEPIQTLAQYVGVVESTRRGQDPILFRGQPRDLPLLPKLARLDLTDDDILSAEREMVEDFRRESLPYLELPPRTAWDWLAVAQHHGMPTRLMDWSLNPLAALWFAVANPPTPGQGPGVVWIFRPALEHFPGPDCDRDKLECERTRVFIPSHFARRITAQVGWFTIHQGHQGDPHFPPLEGIDGFVGCLTKSVVPPDRFAHLRFHLDGLGINHAAIYPGLDGICSHIQWKNVYYSDECPNRVRN